MSSSGSPRAGSLVESPTAFNRPRRPGSSAFGAWRGHLGPWPALAALLVTAAAVALGYSRGIPLARLAGASAGVYLLLLGYFELASPRFQTRLAEGARASRSFPWLAALTLTLPYVVYSLPMRSFSLRTLACLLLYLGLPLSLLGLQRRATPLRDFLALLLVWIPLEMRWLPPLWPWPGQSGHSLDGLLGVLLAVVCFRGLRDLQGIGFILIPTKRDWKLAGLGAALFLPAAVGIGLLTGFARPVSHAPAVLPSLASVLGIFLVTGVPEELLFRGLLQNLLFQWSRSSLLSLALSAGIFGAAHWNVGEHMDWRLVLLATMAGLLYGRLYQRTRGIMAPALAHTLVNAIWVIFFRV